MNLSTNPHIFHIQALKRHKKGIEMAQNLLIQLANHVWPIMKKRNWKVRNLVEFLPSNPNLLGLNINRGREIKIRLRPAHCSDGEFYPFHHLLGTLLHELVHIVRGPHDTQFYKFLDELWEEYELDIGNRMPDGSMVGGRQVSDGETNKLQILNAEKRASLAKVMPQGGRKLGGSKVKDLKKAILDAAERRAKDSKWCGSHDDIVEIRDPSEISKVRNPTEIVQIKDPTNTDNVEVIVISSDSELDEPPSKKNRLQKEYIIWICNTCTLSNQPKSLVCDACLSSRA